MMVASHKMINLIVTKIVYSRKFLVECWAVTGALHAASQIRPDVNKLQFGEAEVVLR